MDCDSKVQYTHEGWLYCGLSIWIAMALQAFLISGFILMHGAHKADGDTCICWTWDLPDTMLHHDLKLGRILWVLLPKQTTIKISAEVTLLRVGYSAISRETPSIALPMTLWDIFLLATANFSLDNTVVAGKKTVLPFSTWTLYYAWQVVWVSWCHNIFNYKFRKLRFRGRDWRTVVVTALDVKHVSHCTTVQLLTVISAFCSYQDEALLLVVFFSHCHSLHTRIQLRWSRDDSYYNCVWAAEREIEKSAEEARTCLFVISELGFTISHF